MQQFHCIIINSSKSLTRKFTTVASCPKSYFVIFVFFFCNRDTYFQIILEEVSLILKLLLQYLYCFPNLVWFQIFLLFPFLLIPFAIFSTRSFHFHKFSNLSIKLVSYSFAQVFSQMVLKFVCFYFFTFFIFVLILFPNGLVLPIPIREYNMPALL